MKREKQMIVTDRGEAIAVIQPLEVLESKKYTSITRPLLPRFQKQMKNKPSKTSLSSSQILSDERDQWI